jgi:protein tyrosine kinase modulator
LLQYTDQHPDVVAIREALARLEAQRAAQIKELGDSAAGQNFSALDSNPIYQALRIALNEAEVDIATLQADVAERTQKLKETKSLVDELPQVEAELARLNRDYDVINEQYQALVKSRETQDLSQKAFDTDKVDFRVIDPPAASEKPVAPKRVRLLAMVFVAALGAAGGLCWLVAQLRPVFVTPASLRAICGLPVLGAVSVFGMARHRIRRRLALLGFVGVMGALIALFAVALIVEVAGPGLHTLAGLA